ncbi:N-acetyltransferase (predicted) [Sugiyamaella lignohabitans]|uniref:N-acetyltransferase (Predicted) n=1 Tax=Sugiyamaella lignohabitans TaxID=796027 RepID=A0A167FN18_9ASCO|nr:N-acetyltransferase (predicted) [Sugiyamaella lignohabitans]ANB15498.1 N-acetyltransferase (predicted) [Sugiyamaella lignohabitans]
MTNTFNIVEVRNSTDLEDTLKLFLKYVEYAGSLGINLAFQDISKELESMPGKYSPPTGELLLARDSTTGKPLACVGLRPLEGSYCEMKRLYVCEEARGLGLGTAMVKKIMEAGKSLGYKQIRLDTVPIMNDAVELYKKCGFETISAYYDTPLENTIFLGCQL